METTAKQRGWTEAEKIGFFIQIAVRAGKIPWDELELPEGRTVKACQVMFDKEKQKVKKASAEKGAGDGAENDKPKQSQPSKGGKKRKAAAADDDAETLDKTSKTGSKKSKKIKEEVKEEDSEE